MSSYMLGSLSNSDYDDYFKQHMNRIYHRSDSFRTMLAGEHDAVLCDDPYCHEYRRPSSSANTRKPRRPSRRRTASVSATSSRREQPRRMPSREDLYGGREHQQDDDWYNYRRPRPRSYIEDNYYGNGTSDNSKNGDSDDDEEEESMNDLEILAQENAKRNALVVVDDLISNSGDMPPPVESTPELVAQQPPEQLQEIAAPQQLPQAENDQQQQQQPQPNSNTTTPTMSTTSSASTPPKKKKKSLFSYLFSRRDQSPIGPTTPSPANSGSPFGRVHAVRSTGPLGDVLDPQQEDELVRQLYSNKDTRSSPLQEQNQQQSHQHSQQTQQTQQQNNLMMVANLDYIWVFRASNNNGTHNIWTTFDYPNQLRIKQHKQMLDRYRLQHDDGVELLDTHIRQGLLPVLVLPNRSEGYYPTNISGEHIVRIEVACIPNRPDIQFVVRQNQQHST